ncbi:hypothetical protein ACFP3Q_04010 [Nocardioides sp. GCM10027113]|uniref:hypothetical protein n=1 Tax=unclassified Nocardioides TaxID=2615069 RepID=UPI0036118FC1
MRRLVVAMVLGLIASLGAAVAPASAVNIGREGCTPGYWKNHTDNWQEAYPDALFSAKFGTAGTSLGGKTLLDTLQGGGGPGVAGAETILARAATAAYLNAAHEGLGFPWRRTDWGLDGRPPLVPTVRDAINTGNRATMLALATRLDADNNLGCPLN